MAFAAVEGKVPELVTLPRPPTLEGMVGAAAILQHATARAVRHGQGRAAAHLAAGLAAVEEGAAAAMQRAAEALETIPEHADGVNILPGPSLAKIVVEGLAGGVFLGGVNEAMLLADKFLRRYGPVISAQLGDQKMLVFVDPTLGDQVQGAKGHKGMGKSFAAFANPVSRAVGGQLDSSR